MNTCVSILVALLAVFGAAFMWQLRPKIGKVPPAPENFVSPDHLVVEWPAQFEFVSPSRELKLAAYRWEPPVGVEVAGIVVIVHGYGDHSDANAAHAALFAQSGFLVVALDIEGHGRSEALYGLRGYVENFNHTTADVLAFVRSESSKHPNLDVFLLGESMGGLISLLSLHAAPELFAGGVLNCPAVDAAEDMYPMLRYVARGLALVAPTLHIAPSIVDEKGLDGLLHDINVHWHYEQDKLTYRGKMAIGTGVAFLDAFDHLQTVVRHQLKEPLLMMIPEHDGVADPEASRKFFEALPSEDKTFDLLEGEVHAFTKDPNWKTHTQRMINWVKERVSPKK